MNGYQCAIVYPSKIIKKGLSTDFFAASLMVAGEEVIFSLTEKLLTMKKVVVSGSVSGECRESVSVGVWLPFVQKLS